MERLTVEQIEDIVDDLRNFDFLPIGREGRKPYEQICKGAEQMRDELLAYKRLEEQIVTTIPKAKREEIGITQEDLRKMLENTSKPQETPRNDRFREFGNICIDAKSVDYIALNTYETGVKRIAYKIGQEKLELIHSICTNEDEEEKFYKTFMEEIEWWKYWKEN